jgi:hypothetical protein
MRNLLLEAQADYARKYLRQPEFSFKRSDLDPFLQPLTTVEGAGDDGYCDTAMGIGREWLRFVLVSVEG